MELLKEYKEKADPYIKEKLIVHNLKLVKHIAIKYRGGGVELDDLFQTGTIGLLRALEGYDINRGTKFSTYAYYWINQSIVRGIENEGRTIRIPSHLLQEINNLKKARTELYKESGKEPTTEEIAVRLDKGIKEVEDLQEIIRDPMSLQHTYSTDEGDVTLEESIKDDSKPLEEVVEEKIFVEGFIKDFRGVAKAELTSLQCDIIHRYYGVGHKRRYTLEELGQQYGVGSEQIRVEREKGLHKLRRTKYIIGLERELDYRTTYYSSIDYTLEGSRAKSNASPVERIVLQREKLLKDIQYTNRSLNYDYESGIRL